MIMGIQGRYRYRIIGWGDRSKEKVVFTNVIDLDIPKIAIVEVDFYYEIEIEIYG